MCEKTDTNLTKLEKCMADLIAIFNEEASKDGDKSTLSREEAIHFVRKELHCFLQEQGASDDDIMKFIDTNASGNVDFQEYCVLLGGLASSLREDLLKMRRKK
ncbi:protein S100-A11-like [Protopterus annectens]|uniref:protein S100-A11-like n=1 Tax=Protopterus annectens TaxID=7888 RepID=UPI001CFBAFEC|nr:protein S100-A11-like [Protopterus annectens]